MGLAALSTTDPAPKNQAINLRSGAELYTHLDDNVEDEMIEEFRPFGEQELADVGGRRTFLLPGDMVELR